MARVDPDDDSINRFIVRHYRYDPARRERRHVVVAAFDNEQEFDTCLHELNAEIEGRRQRGEPVDPNEQITGEIQEPGYRRKQQNARMVERAFQHGVTPTPLENLDLPSNYGLVSAGRRPSFWHRLWSRLRRLG